jgi:hypothetical protein
MTTRAEVHRHSAGRAERKKAEVASAGKPCACSPPWKWCCLHFTALSEKDQARVRRGARVDAR